MRFFLFFILFFCQFTAFSQRDTAFWFAAPEVSQNAGSNFDRPIIFRITAYSTAATVTISEPAGGGMPMQTVTVPANSTSSVDLSSWVNNIENKPANAVLNYGLKISSSAPVSVYYEVKSGGSGGCLCNPETFVLKGDHANGTDFWIPGQNSLDNSTGSTYTPNPFNSFDIVATQDATTVTITPSHAIVGHAAGVAFSITLNKGQTYSATATSETAANHLQGSRVTSNKPIAITEKDDLVYFSDFTDYGLDLIGDQIVPTTSLGTEYIPMYGYLASSTGEQLYITATQNGTTISVGGSYVTTINAGQTYQMTTPSPAAYIQTSAPVYIYQVTGTGVEISSSLLTPLQCTGSSSASFVQSLGFNTVLNILVQNGGQGSFLVNGAAGVITSSSFSVVPGTGGNWYTAQVTLSTGTYPTGSVVSVSNSSTYVFHMGLLNGEGYGAGSSYAYFADYSLPPAASATTTTHALCFGDSIHLFADTVASGAYSWSGPGGFSSTLQDPVIGPALIADSGLYFLTVTAAGCSATDTLLVNIIAGPVHSFSHDTTLCANSASLYAPAGYATRLWSTGSVAPFINITAGGTYWVASFDTCTERADTFHVAMTIPPPVHLGRDTAFCDGNSITLTSPAPPGYQNAWSTGYSGPSITVSTSGVYWLDTYDSVCRSIDTIVITVKPIPGVTLGNDTSLCAGIPLTLRSSATYTSPSYLWSTGATTPSITVSSSGSYWLGVTMLGCTGYDTINVNYYPLPVINFPVTTICNGEPLILSSPQPPGAQYLWNTGSTASAITVAQGGTYILSVTSNGCTSIDTAVVTSASTPFINLGPDTVLCDGYVLHLFIQSQNAQFLWSNGSSGSTYDVTTAGIYWATVSNGCGIASDTLHADYTFCNIWLPTGFTPNLDGKNDIFRPLGSLSGYSDVVFNIYNRWGQLIFTTKDVTQGWDGTFNGEPQELGTYFYYLTFSLNGQKGSMKGDFQLVR